MLAESWGLMHESVGAEPQRCLVVWKPSRSRRSLKPSMLASQGLAAAASDASGTAGSGSGASPGGLGQRQQQQEQLHQADYSRGAGEADEEGEAADALARPY